MFTKILTWLGLWKPDEISQFNSGFQYAVEQHKSGVSLDDLEAQADSQFDNVWFDRGIRQFLRIGPGSNQNQNTTA
jgi:hypothetical protein